MRVRVPNRAERSFSAPPPLPPPPLQHHWTGPGKSEGSWACSVTATAGSLAQLETERREGARRQRGFGQGGGGGRGELERRPVGRGRYGREAGEGRAGEVRAAV